MQSEPAHDNPRTADSASALHELREQLLDPVTVRRLAGLGIRKGWRCAEVGAGSGSIAQWLADKVGPRGQVVATEICTRHLGHVARDNLEVREHDLRQGGLEHEAYHLVHCRAVLMHLPQPETVLPHLVASLKPGGRLLLEEADLGSFGAADLSHPAAERFNRISRLLIEACRNAQIMDPYVGRRLRGMLETADLTYAAQDGITWVHRGGEDAARFMQMGFHNLMRDPRMAAWLAEERELARFEDTFQDPSFPFVNFTLFGVWGRRPK